MDEEFVSLSEGSGGAEMRKLIQRMGFEFRGSWKSCDDDASILSLGNGKNLVFTTDSYVVNPAFFPGGDIGHLAFCGTVNDLAVMGAKPKGLSLAIVLEEGFPKGDLDKVIGSIKRLSAEFEIPIVTGDTKVMEKGKIDGIVVNTAGVGMASDAELLTKGVSIGDKIILSGGLGEHAVALLSKRFGYETSVLSDSKALVQEIDAVNHLIKTARDVTRGGLAAVLNEYLKIYGLGCRIVEDQVPAKGEVRRVVDMLGLSLYELACEGRFVCTVPEENADEVVDLLMSFNGEARIIGEFTNSSKVVVKTFLGERILPEPTGRIVPRIC